MNKWQMDGGTIERWAGGGGREICNLNIVHRSIHPLGRTPEYRALNKLNRFKPKMHGRRDEGYEPKSRRK